MIIAEAVAECVHSITLRDGKFASPGSSYGISFCLVTDASRAATLVQLDTPLGAMTFNLYDAEKPVTVANFLNYVTSGRYTNTFSHRLVPDFILQGGGYALDGSGSLVPVQTFSPIINEAGPFPQFSNTYGTLAMAKVSGDPNSATSQWFINLGDNSANLDSQNSGFTVFGEIVDGESVLQEFLNFVLLPPGTPTASNVVVNIGGPFTELPVTAVNNFTVTTSDLIMTQWSIIPEPSQIILFSLGLFAFIFRQKPSRVFCYDVNEFPRNNNDFSDG